MKLDKMEKKVVIIAVLGTVLITVGFTMSQGKFKSKHDTYTPSEAVSGINQNVVNKDEYKIINTDSSNIQKYTIYCKREFNSKEITYITEQLIKEDENMKSGYELYLFTDEQKSNDFNGEKENIEIKVVPKDESQINIQNYHYISDIKELIPTEFEVLNVEKVEKVTKAEVIIENIQSPKEALAQVRFFGLILQSENSNKNIGILNIIAHTSNEKKENWEYDGNYKTLIINNVYETLNQ
jgi:hypothetical protein